MKKELFIACTFLISLNACQKEDVVPGGQVKAVWSSSAQYASWSNGGYTIYNDVWGSGAGYQSIWANSYSNWGVWANHPNTGGIKSYPNCTKYVGRQLSQLGSCTSYFNATTPSGGAWESTYDIWDGNKANEIMLWMNYTGNTDGSGNVKPISYNWNASGNPMPVYTNQSIGGHTWNVFRGNNGKNNVYSFLRTSKTNSGTVDVKAMLNWIKGRGWIGDVMLGDVQYGFEITSCYGTNGSGMNFTTNSYSVSFQ
jgi:Glycosyl hydrolase family 12